MIAGLQPDMVQMQAPPVVPQSMQPDFSSPSPAPKARTIEKTVPPAKPRSINLAVQFDSDSSQIKPESYPLLNELGKALISDKLKDKRVLIAGHTDSDASPEYNMKLSKERAEAVKKYLTSNFPIAAQRIGTTGFGETLPLVPNTNKYNKLLNRRVQVSIAP